MKKISIFCTSLLFAINTSFSQQAEPCATEIVFQQQALKYPSLLKKREELEEQIAKYISENKNQKQATAPRIIPVVFHIIHEGGGENISKAQVQDQIRILNEDYRRSNSDAQNTPSVFQGAAVDCNIEFRLAQKDTNGNCTDGIVRVYSPLTNGPINRDDVKSLSYWNSKNYLNIWVVKNIHKGTSSGNVLGYAQFPGGDPTTDGIVVRSDYVGSIGTAIVQNFKGRVLAHEVGHWLSLRHLWGDSNCGNDLVADTPMQEKPNSGCPQFPHISCINGPDGDMFSNYMDYTNGNCQNFFTAGQKNKMDAILAVSRYNLVSSANNIATGTNTTTTSLCPPIPDFTVDHQLLCAGDSVIFTDASFNGEATTWIWTTFGGTPPVTNTQNPIITYNNAGVYDVTLTAINSSGTTSITKSNLIFVNVDGGWYPTPYSEGFENAFYPNADWFIMNNDGGKTWEKTTAVSYSGNSSMMIKNFSGNRQFEYDDLIGPPLDLTTMTSAQLSFRLAYAQKNSSSNDRLTVSVSTDCGAHWAMKYNKLGSGLTTAGIQAADFVPSLSQWKQETISLSPYLNNKNVRFRFEFTSGDGNNIYIDDINISGTVNTEGEIIDDLNLNIYPNPAQNNSIVSFYLSTPENVSLNIYDVLGRETMIIANEKLNIGEHRFTIDKIKNEGIYFLKLGIGNKFFTKKLVVSSN